MNKKIIFKYFGGAAYCARVLGYAHRNVCHAWEPNLKWRQVSQIIKRMKERNIPVPEKWEADLEVMKEKHNDSLLRHTA